MTGESTDGEVEAGEVEAGGAAPPPPPDVMEESADISVAPPPNQAHIIASSGTLNLRSQQKIQLRNALNALLEIDFHHLERPVEGALPFAEIEAYKERIEGILAEADLKAPVDQRLQRVIGGNVRDVSTWGHWVHDLIGNNIHNLRTGLTGCVGLLDAITELPTLESNFLSQISSTLTAMQDVSRKDVEYCQSTIQQRIDFLNSTPEPMQTEEIDRVTAGLDAIIAKIPEAPAIVSLDFQKTLEGDFNNLCENLQDLVNSPHYASEEQKPEIDKRISTLETILSTRCEADPAGSKCTSNCQYKFNTLNRSIKCITTIPQPLPVEIRQDLLTALQEMKETITHYDEVAKERLDQLTQEAESLKNTITLG